MKTFAVTLKFVDDNGWVLGFSTIFVEASDTWDAKAIAKMMHPVGEVDSVEEN